MLTCLGKSSLQSLVCSALLCAALLYFVLLRAAAHRLVVSLAAFVWLTFPADEIVMNGWGAQMLVTQRGLS
eukprot:COSAG06_NODE_35723_length_456_cov_1.011204_1_plen_70_part_01